MTAKLTQEERNKLKDESTPRSQRRGVYVSTTFECHACETINEITFKKPTIGQNRIFSGNCVVCDSVSTIRARRLESGKAEIIPYEIDISDAGARIYNNRKALEKSKNGT